MEHYEDGDHHGGWKGDKEHKGKGKKWDDD
jgi:hypothetical protein